MPISSKPLSCSCSRSERYDKNRSRLRLSSQAPAVRVPAAGRCEGSAGTGPDPMDALSSEAEEGDAPPLVPGAKAPEVSGAAGAGVAELAVTPSTTAAPLVSPSRPGRRG